jgi:hypothetical protein
MPDDQQGEQQIPELGEPTSYLAVRRGVPVYTSDGTHLGKLVEVRKEDRADMFDGIVVDTAAGPGGHKFVDAPEVRELYERGVVLTIGAAEAADLEKPKTHKVPGGFWARLTGR